MGVSSKFTLVGLLFDIFYVLSAEAKDEHKSYTELTVFFQLHQKLADSNMSGLDSKEWKSVVLPKIYEEKMQKLEAELEKKVGFPFFFLFFNRLLLCFPVSFNAIVSSAHEQFILCSVAQQNCL